MTAIGYDLRFDHRPGSRKRFNGYGYFHLELAILLGGGKNRYYLMIIAMEGLLRGKDLLAVNNLRQ